MTDSLRSQLAHQCRHLEARVLQAQAWRIPTNFGSSAEDDFLQAIVEGSKLLASFRARASAIRATLTAWQRHVLAMPAGADRDAEISHLQESLEHFDVRLRDAEAAITPVDVGVQALQIQLQTWFPGTPAPQGAISELPLDFSVFDPAAVSVVPSGPPSPVASRTVVLAPTVTRATPSITVPTTTVTVTSASMSQALMSTRTSGMPAPSLIGPPHQPASSLLVARPASAPSTHFAAHIPIMPSPSPTHVPVPPYPGYPALGIPTGFGTAAHPGPGPPGPPPPPRPGPLGRPLPPSAGPAGPAFYGTAVPSRWTAPRAAAAAAHAATAHAAPAHVALAPTTDLPKLPPLELPTFSGKAEDWLSFRETFLQRVDARPGLSEVDKYLYLAHALKSGSAAAFTKGFEASPMAYREAWSSLEHEYGDATTLRLRLQEKLQGLPMPPESDIDSTWHLLREVELLCRQMRHLGEDPDHNSFVETAVYTKLPKWLKAKVLELKQIAFPGTWNTVALLTVANNAVRLRRSLRDSPVERVDPSLDTFAVRSENPLPSHDGDQGKDAFGRASPKSPRAKHFESHGGRSSPTSEPARPGRQQAENRRRPPCRLCGGDDGHAPSLCPRFITPATRLARVRELGLCNNCLKPAHGYCTDVFKCPFSCGTSGHHPAVCLRGPGADSSGPPPSPQGPGAALPSPASPAVAATTATMASVIRSATLASQSPSEKKLLPSRRVTIANPRTGVCTQAVAVLDTCSNTSYITERAARRLGLRPRSRAPKSLELTTFAASKRRVNSSVYVVEVLTCVGTSRKVVAQCLPELTGPIPALAESCLTSSKVRLETVKPDILIGSDYLDRFVRLPTRILPTGHRALLTDLGDVPYGSVPGHGRHRDSSPITFFAHSSSDKVNKRDTASVRPGHSQVPEEIARPIRDSAFESPVAPSVPEPETASSATVSSTTTTVLASTSPVDGARVPRWRNLVEAPTRVLRALRRLLPRRKKQFESLPLRAAASFLPSPKSPQVESPASPAATTDSHLAASVRRERGPSAPRRRRLALPLLSSTGSSGAPVLRQAEPARSQTRKRASVKSFKSSEPWAFPTTDKQPLASPVREPVPLEKKLPGAPKPPIWRLSAYLTVPVDATSTVVAPVSSLVNRWHHVEPGGNGPSLLALRRLAPFSLLVAPGIPSPARPFEERVDVLDSDIASTSDPLLCLQNHPSKPRLGINLSSPSLPTLLLRSLPVSRPLWDRASSLMALAEEQGLPQRQRRPQQERAKRKSAARSFLVKATHGVPPRDVSLFLAVPGHLTLPRASEVAAGVQPAVFAPPRELSPRLTPMRAPLLAASLAVLCLFEGIQPERGEHRSSDPLAGEGEPREEGLRPSIEAQGRPFQGRRLSSRGTLNDALAHANAESPSTVLLEVRGAAVSPQTAPPPAEDVGRREATTSALEPILSAYRQSGTAIGFDSASSTASRFEKPGIGPSKGQATDLGRARAICSPPLALRSNPEANRRLAADLTDLDPLGSTSETAAVTASAAPGAVKDGENVLLSPHRVESLRLRHAHSGRVCLAEDSSLARLVRQAPRAARASSCASGIPEGHGLRGRRAHRPSRRLALSSSLRPRRGRGRRGAIRPASPGAPLGPAGPGELLAIHGPASPGAPLGPAGPGELLAIHGPADPPVVPEPDHAGHPAASSGYDRPPHAHARATEGVEGDASHARSPPADEPRLCSSRTSLIRRAPPLSPAASQQGLPGLLWPAFKEAGLLALIALWCYRILARFLGESKRLSPKRAPLPASSMLFLLLAMGVLVSVTEAQPGNEAPPTTGEPADSGDGPRHVRAAGPGPPQGQPRRPVLGHGPPLPASSSIRICSREAADMFRALRGAIPPDAPRGDETLSPRLSSPPARRVHNADSGHNGPRVGSEPTPFLVHALEANPFQALEQRPLASPDAPQASTAADACWCGHGVANGHVCAGFFLGTDPLEFGRIARRLPSGHIAFELVRLPDAPANTPRPRDNFDHRRMRRQLANAFLRRLAAAPATPESPPQLDELQHYLAMALAYVLYRQGHEIGFLLHLVIAGLLLGSAGSCTTAPSVPEAQLLQPEGLLHGVASQTARPSLPPAESATSLAPALTGPFRFVYGETPLQGTPPAPKGRVPTGGAHSSLGSRPESVEKPIAGLDAVGDTSIAKGLAPCEPPSSVTLQPQPAELELELPPTTGKSAHGATTPLSGEQAELQSLLKSDHQQPPPAFERAQSMAPTGAALQPTLVGRPGKRPSTPLLPLSAQVDPAPQSDPPSTEAAAKALIGGIAVDPRLLEVLQQDGQVLESLHQEPAGHRRPPAPLSVLVPSGDARATRSLAAVPQSLREIARLARSPSAFSSFESFVGPARRSSSRSENFDYAKKPYAHDVTSTLNGFYDGDDD